MVRRGAGSPAPRAPTETPAVNESLNPHPTGTTVTSPRRRSRCRWSWPLTGRPSNALSSSETRRSPSCAKRTSNSGHAQKTGDFLKGDFRRIAERRNNCKVAGVAVARKILTLVYYGLRDGEIRCLAEDAG